MVDSNTKEGAYLYALKVQIMAAFVFGSIYYFFKKENLIKQETTGKDIELQELNQKRIDLDTLLAFNTILRDMLVLRTVSSRAYAFHTEEYGEPVHIDGHESILALVSLCYLLSAGVNAYIYGKNFDLTQEEKNKMMYDLLDSVTWSAISIMRLPGTAAELVFDIEWFEISTMLLDSFVLGAYVIELAYTVIYDIQELNRISAELHEKPGDEELLYKQSKAQVTLAIDTLHLLSMVVGVSLKMAAVAGATGTPVGLLLMVIATVGNQMKNLYYACKELNRALKKYEETHDLRELHKAQAKFATEFTKLSIIFAAIGLLAFGNPIGAGIFAVGIIAYLMVKGVSLRIEKNYSSTATALPILGSQGPATTSNNHGDQTTLPLTPPTPRQY
jgi:hypothetical protein